MNKSDNRLVIKAPNQGIGPSPHVGYADIRNFDIFTIPGIARLNNLLAKKSGSTVTSFPLWFKKNPRTPSELFALDNTGAVYRSTDSGDTWSLLTGNTTGGLGHGLAIWKDYLIVARTTNLDLYGPLSGSRAWTNSWQTIDSDTLWHPMLVSKNDNKIYGGAGKYIYSIDENTGQTFVPGTPASYTWTPQALDLPPDCRIKCLTELGNNLEMGTWKGINIYDFRTADIYPWDRSSPTFGTPISLEENGVHSLLTIGNLMYAQAGIDGKLYASNGASASMIAQVPSSVADLEGGLYLEPFPGAIMNYKGRPFFGVSTGGSASTSGMGIWSLLQTSKGNILTYENSISTGNDGTTNPLKIGALLGIARDMFIAGWSDTSSYGIDKINNTARYTGYAGYFKSALYTVGSNLLKREFTQLEFLLAKPLETGQGIRISYRTNLTDAFTQIGDYLFSDLGGVISHNVAAGIPYCEQLQILVELKANSSSNSSPYYKSVTLI